MEVKQQEEKGREVNMVDHAWNLSYSGDGDWEDHGSERASAKKLVRPYLNQQAGHGGSHLSFQLLERP
jgi:hypothetical protein